MIQLALLQFSPAFHVAAQFFIFKPYFFKSAAFFLQPTGKKKIP